VAETVLAAVDQDVVLYQGDGVDLDFTVYQSDGVTPKNVTGAAFDWKAARKLSSDAPLITKSTASGITVADALNGLVKVALATGNTSALDGEYEHELVMTLSGKPKTVATGKLTVWPSLVK